MLQLFRNPTIFCTLIRKQKSISNFEFKPCNISRQSSSFKLPPYNKKPFLRPFKTSNKSARSTTYPTRCHARSKAQHVRELFQSNSTVSSPSSASNFGLNQLTSTSYLPLRDPPPWKSCTQTCVIMSDMCNHEQYKS